MVAEGCLAAWRLACHPHPNACSCLQPGRAEQGGASMLGCSFVLLWLCLVLHQGGRERLEPYWAKEAVEQVTYAHPPCPPAPCTAARATGEPSNSICHSALWSSCHQPPAPPPPPPWRSSTPASTLSPPHWGSIMAREKQVDKQKGSTPASYANNYLSHLCRQHQSAPKTLPKGTGSNVRIKKKTLICCK